jgi:tetratricopeptide (TPR) repeat protein
VARCLADTRALDRALHDHLIVTDARLPLARAIAPYNVSLAHLAISSHPDQAVAHFWLADALANRDEVEQAIQEYETGLALHATEANAWQALGHLREARGDMNQAVAAYDQACHFVDHGKNGCVAAAHLHMQLGQYAKALESYKNMIAQLPYLDLSTKLRPVDSFLKLGRTGEATEYLCYLVDHGVPEARPLLEQQEQK